jgi:hypothetical protein
VRIRAIESAVMFWLSGSTSANMGTAPRRMNALAEAMNVRGVTTTSSPSPIPRARNALSSATVPFAMATAYPAPTYEANSFSKIRPSSPVQ